MTMDALAHSEPANLDGFGVGSQRGSGWKESPSIDAGSCRANSRRGTTDQIKPSYPPVESVRRALEILRVVNQLKIATVGEIHAATRLPKPTIVRMLDTLVAEGYVARDNMCGGYRVTRRVQELDSGYEGIAQIIEVARPFAIDLTNRIKWPVGIGTLGRDAMAVHFWTGTISPWVHANTLLGHRPNLVTSAMGRAYLAYCGEAERQAAFQALRESRPGSFSLEQEEQFNSLLANVRENGYALRSPHTEPRRNTTVAVPIRPGGRVMASITVSFFTSAIPRNRVADTVIEPLKETVRKMEDVIQFMRSDHQKSRAEAGIDVHAMTL